MKNGSLLIVVMLAMMTMGCADTAVLAGNGASMLVASVLLWSTVNINRSPDDKGHQ